jgi:putative ABC transport system substrate-binding protein
MSSVGAKAANVTFEYRWLEGRPERAAELVAVIVSGGGTPAAKQKATAIPIVFVVVADPVDSKLVASLARPGGNITGPSNEQAYVAASVWRFYASSPGLHRLGFSGTTGNPAVALDKREVETIARFAGPEFVAPQFQKADKIVPAFAAINGRVYGADESRPLCPFWERPGVHWR